MTQVKSEEKETSNPRFEFRSFGQDFEKAHYRMSGLSVPVPENFRERESEEIYIVSRTIDSINIKIRDGKIDIKTLIQTVDDLEQWKPVMKEKFPVKASILQHKVFTAFLAKNPVSIRADYSFDEFLEMAKASPDLLPVRVKKRRFGYKVNNTICEFGLVWINDARVCTISSESTEIENIKKTISDIGLSGVENINYLQAIKRVTGMVDKPLANE
jgi:hypothetical protein